MSTNIVEYNYNILGAYYKKRQNISQLLVTHEVLDLLAMQHLCLVGLRAF